MGLFDFLRRPKKSDTPKPYYMISGDLNITMIIDGQSHSVDASHPNHAAVLTAIRQENWDAMYDLIDIPRALEAYSDGRVQISSNGEVMYDGQVIQSAIADRISMFFHKGLDFKPLVRFMENLMNNPSGRAVEELYPFLENRGMAITEDGCFVGYKSVNNDYTDIHTGKFSNKPGDVHEMPRNLVDDDARKSCSNGFHIGSQAYASNFGGNECRMMLVKVNPADAVSVPFADAGKLRACRYEVLSEVDRQFIIEEPLYVPSEEGLEEQTAELEEMIGEVMNDDSKTSEVSRTITYDPLEKFFHDFGNHDEPYDDEDEFPF